MSVALFADLSSDGHRPPLQLQFPRPLALLDESPELARFPKLRVLGRRQFTAEKKIAQCVFVQDTMHGDPFVALLEINPVIFRAKTI